MEIRCVEKKDISQVVELCRLHAEYEKATYDVKDKEELLSKAILAQFSVLKVLVVAQKNAIVGYATYMKQFSTWNADFYIYLDCLFLKEEARGKGLGKALMNKIIEYAKSENCASMQWQTPQSNKKAIEFYRKIGGISKAKERFFIRV